MVRNARRPTSKRVVLLLASVLMLGALLLTPWAVHPVISAVEVTLLALLMFSFAVRKRARYVWPQTLLLCSLSAVYATDEWFWFLGKSRPFVLICAFIIVSIGSAAFTVADGRLAFKNSRAAGGHDLSDDSPPS